MSGYMETRMQDQYDAWDQRVLELHQDSLTIAWRAVDACGGTYSAEEIASGYAEGHKAALNAACEAIEKLGGRPHGITLDDNGKVVLTPKGGA